MRIRIECRVYGHRIAYINEPTQWYVWWHVVLVERTIFFTVYGGHSPDTAWDTQAQSGTARHSQTHVTQPDARDTARRT